MISLPEDRGDGSEALIEGWGTGCTIPVTAQKYRAELLVEEPSGLMSILPAWGLRTTTLRPLWWCISWRWCPALTRTACSWAKPPLGWRLSCIPHGGPRNREHLWSDGCWPVLGHRPSPPSRRITAWRAWHFPAPLWSNWLWSRRSPLTCPS